MSAAVYGFVNAEGQYLYIGCTEHLKHRVNNHRRKPWWPEVVQIRLLGQALSIKEARDLERRSIEHFEPRHNYVFTAAWRAEHALDTAHIDARPLTDAELARVRAAFQSPTEAVA